METSRLGKLSAEIRNHIYELALTQDEPINITSNEVPFGRQRLSRYNKNQHPLALALTCRQAHHECLQLFYASNSFIFYLDNGLPSDFEDVSEMALTFLKRLDQEARTSIPRITLSTTGVLSHFELLHRLCFARNLLYKGLRYLTWLAPELFKLIPSCEIIAELGAGDLARYEDIAFHLELAGGQIDYNTAFEELRSAIDWYQDSPDYSWALQSFRNDLGNFCYEAELQS